MRNGMLISVLVGLFLAPPLKAQYVQGGAINAAPDTIGGDWTAKTKYSFTFAKPTTAPCTIMVSLRNPGQTVSDSQGNTFALATGNPGNYDQLWYSKTCLGAADTITVTCAAACWSQFTVSEYAGVWVADQFSNDTNATGLSSYTAPITPTQSGELIIGFGSNHATNTPQLTAGTGFTLRANANEFIEDLLQVTAAPIFSSVTYPASLTWCQSTVSFKPGGPPAQNKSLIVKAQLLWCTVCNQTDDVAAAGRLVIAQTNGPTGTFVIQTDGSISASGIIDIAQDPLEFTLWLIDSTGIAQPGASMKQTVPRFALYSPSFTLSTLSLGVVRISHVTIPLGGTLAVGTTCQIQAGCPAVRLASIDQFKLL